MTDIDGTTFVDSNGIAVDSLENPERLAIDKIRLWTQILGRSGASSELA
jgi:hypothetical protein